MRIPSQHLSDDCFVAADPLSPQVSQVHREASVHQDRPADPRAHQVCFMALHHDCAAVWGVVLNGLLLGSAACGTLAEHTAG